MTDHELLKIRELALYKVNNTLPSKSELPDVHIARCWYESFREMKGFDKTIVDEYEFRLTGIKNVAIERAIHCSNDVENASKKLGVTCHPTARNPGLFFGYLLAIKDIMEILNGK